LSARIQSYPNDSNIRIHNLRVAEYVH